MEILVIEDDKRLAAARKGGLEKEGYAVDVALDGGCGLAAGHTYEVIVLDITLPSLNGDQVGVGLRAVGDWTPLLMPTAEGGEFDETEPLGPADDDHLAKPFSYVVFLTHLRALVRRGSHGRPPVLTVGDLELNPAPGLVGRRGRLVELTSSEFVVLEYLARRAREVVSTSELIGHASEFACEGDVNAVDVEISNRRASIDKPFLRRRIQTVRGMGYRLVPDGR